LSKFNPEAETFRNYDVHDGLVFQGHDCILSGTIKR
jgi:hypothetical protein